MNDAPYRKRFKSGWTEQVMVGCEKLTREAREASLHNEEGDFDTLYYLYNELTAELWNKGFKPSDLKRCLQGVVDNPFANRPDEDNEFTRSQARVGKSV